MFSKNDEKIIIRFLSNKASAKDKKIIQEQMDIDPDFNNFIFMMQKAWNAKQTDIKIKDLDLKWIHMRNRIENELRDLRIEAELDRKWGRRSVRPAWLSGSRLIPVAALCVLVLAGSFHIMKNMFITDSNVVNIASEMETIEVAYGERARIELSDGTRIMLDAGSKLTYPLLFSGNKREVTLEGEGFFEVAKDKSHPFVVHAKQAEIEVLGTKFNVRAWEENEAITVAVKEGLVSLAQAEDSTHHRVLIGGGNQSQLDENGELSEVTKTDVAQHISWMNNEIHMKNVKLKEVLAQLTRWYDFEFHVQDTNLLDTQITVHIRKTNIDDVFELIGMITHTTVERDSNVIRMLNE